MSEKPESIFEKLDSQTDKIDDISEKLNGVSVNDLYALAKRTWDYGDFETAQKYYNHISLLRPLDWEAPLYATLCNFKGYHDMFFWTKVPEQLEPVIVSTIKYVNDLSIEKKKKESEMARCVDIIEKYMTGTVDHYFKYSKEYSNTNGNYIFELEEWFINILEEVKNIKLKAIKSFCSFLADACLRIIETIQLLSSNINKEVFDYLNSIASQKWNIDYAALIKKQEEQNIKSATSGSKLSAEEKVDIMLKGKMYYEFNDKVVSKRLTRRYFIFGLIILLSSIAGVPFSFLTLPFVSAIFFVSILMGVVLLIKSVSEKDRICCSSILTYRRKKCRLTSNNSVIKESSISVFAIFAIASLVLALFAGIFMSIVVFTSLKSVEQGLKVGFCICAAINGTAQYIAVIYFASNSYIEGDYKYLYNGKFYCFK